MYIILKLKYNIIKRMLCINNNKSNIIISKIKKINFLKIRIWIRIFRFKNQDIRIWIRF